MKRLLKAVLLPAAMLCALTASSHAQTTFNAIGSSALYLELGEAAYSNNAASCAWSTSSKDVVATDTSTGSSLTDAGTAWVVWVPTSGNTCSSNATPAVVYGYENTDSVVGDRCLFNAHAGGLCSISYAAAAGTSPAGTIEGSNEVALPSAVAAALTSSVVNAAGTDIRPEDAEFAITRALTPCGSSTTGTGGSIAPYLGLGYSNGGSIVSHFSSSSFNVINFSLPSTFYVQPVGVDPIIVVVNSTSPSGTGFNNGGTNVYRATLAGYLDGSIGSTTAIGGKGVPGTAEPSTVMIREPLSGTYNTMEYNIPNTRAFETSQDVGVNQLSSQANCNGTVPASNPMAIENTTTGSFRYRAIGTGQELSETFATNNALGYAFWGVSNFAAAPSTARYLMVESIDPILTTYHQGVIPVTQTGNNGLNEITFQHILDGSYPIWSLLRIVTVDTTTKGIAKTLAVAAANFSTTGGTVSHPDFVPYYKTNGQISFNNERSHFAPPGISFPGSNGIANQPGNGGVSFYGGAGACTGTEAGGDVGGVTIPIAYTDQDYCTDTGSVYGIINRRN